MGYGTGAIMAVPAHDERDFEFATKYQIPVVQVIEPADFSGNGEGRPTLPYSGDGNLIHSDGYSGLPWQDAKSQIVADLESKGRGKSTINFKLRDWLFSRQRYWGEPIPIVWVSEEDYRAIESGKSVTLPDDPVFFEEDGVKQFAVPVPDSALPLELPAVESYLPSDNGESPLANAEDWVNVWFEVSSGQSVPASQPRPEGAGWVLGRRETNTMPQWAGSCWYYLRYLDPTNETAIASQDSLKYWGTPDLYVGGAEHAVLHLLYARFWHKVLFDEGVLPHNEPFQRLFHQGIILGEDGDKMSKSKGNVVSPDTIIASHGADTLRLYLMFLGPLEAMKPWNPRGIEGLYRFLQKIWRSLIDEDGKLRSSVVDEEKQEPAELTRVLHETIKKVSVDTENLRFNTAISQMMIFANALHKSPIVAKSTVRAFTQLLTPYAPHFGEELWSILGGFTSVVESGWPEFNPVLLESETQIIVVQINGKRRAEIELPKNADEAVAIESAKINDNVQSHLEGKEIRRIIYIKNRILNIVVG